MADTNSNSINDIQIIEELQKRLNSSQKFESKDNVARKLNEIYKALEKLEGKSGTEAVVRTLNEHRVALEKLYNIQNERDKASAELFADLKERAGERSIDKDELDKLKEYREKNNKLLELVASKLENEEASQNATNQEDKDRYSRNAQSNQAEIDALRQEIQDDIEKLQTEGFGALHDTLQNYEDNRNLEEEGKQRKEINRLIAQEEKAVKEVNAAEREGNKILEEKKQNTEKLNESWQKLKSGFREIWGQIKQGGSVWMDFNQQAIADSKRLGITTTKAANAYNRSLMAGSKELMRNFGLSREEATKMQETFQNVTGRAILFNQQQMEDITAASSLMGKENVAAAIQSMDAMGSTADRAVELMDSNYARAKNSGLDTVKASEAFVKNMALANKLTFRGGVDGISKMTILSQKLKFNLDSVAGVAEKFSTIEGALQGSAQMQMLGGTGAMYAGNPMQMLYESLTDAEGLTERMTKMWGDSATFNRKTGEAEVSAYQRQIIKAQAEAMGFSYEDAMNMTKNQAKLTQMEADTGIARKYGKDSETTALIENKAQYNKENGQWEITWNKENGERVTSGVTNLSASDLKEIQGDVIDPVDDIKGNVRKIASTLISLRDRKNSLFGVWDTSKAQLINRPMEGINGVATDAAQGNGLAGDLFGWGTNGNMWGTGTLWGLAALGGAITGIKGLYGVGKYGIKSIKNIFGSGKGIANTSKSVPTPGTLPSNAPVNPTATNGVGMGTRFSNGVRSVANLGRVEGNAAAFSKAGNSIGTLRNIATTVRAVKTGARSSGILAGAAEVIGAGIDYYSAGQEREATNAELGRMTTMRNGVTGQNRFSQRYLQNRATEAENREDREKRGAIGQGIGGVLGAAGGIAAGAAAGAAIGTAIPIPVVGTLAGMAIGAGMAWIGGKIGKSIGESTGKEKGIVENELDEINDNDADDNIKKIVLPVESIDYNVALIANQLGIMTAMPARNNIYLKAEEAGEIEGPGSQENEGMTPYDRQVAIANGDVTYYNANPMTVMGQNLQASRVSPYDSNSYGQQYHPTNNKLDVTFTGQIELTSNGNSVGKLTSKEIADLAKNRAFIDALVKAMKDNTKQSPSTTNKDAIGQMSSVNANNMDAASRSYMG